MRNLWPEQAWLSDPGKTNRGKCHHRAGQTPRPSPPLRAVFGRAFAAPCPSRGTSPDFTGLSPRLIVSSLDERSKCCQWSAACLISPVSGESVNSLWRETRGSSKRLLMEKLRRPRTLILLWPVSRPCPSEKRYQRWGGSIPSTVLF